MFDNVPSTREGNIPLPFSNFLPETPVTNDGCIKKLFNMFYVTEECLLKNKDINKWLKMSIFIVGLMKNEKSWGDVKDKGYEESRVNWGEL